MFKPDERTALNLTDLSDGAYRVTVESGGRTVKAYPLSVAGGQLVAHPRSDLSTSRETWLAPVNSVRDPLTWLVAE